MKNRARQSINRDAFITKSADAEAFDRCLECDAPLPRDARWRRCTKCVLDSRVKKALAALAQEDRKQYRLSMAQLLDRLETIE